jgi:acetyltransferase-like isoleucine patch superfamily enzyme
MVKNVDLNLNYKTSSPVLLLVFNRIDTIKKVFEVVRSVQPARLYISGDGPRNDRKDEDKKVNAVRDYILSRIDWECDVFTLFNEDNIGCKCAIVKGINWFFEHETFGIILEDDCLPHPDFFRFCDELGPRYQNDVDVVAISGTNIQIKSYIEEDYFFSMMGGIWGWATWKRAWSHYVADIDGILKRENWKIIKKNIDCSDIYHCLKSVIMSSRLVMRNSTWDFQWLFVRCLMNGKTIVPNINLISNMGFDADSTHTGDINNPLSNLPAYPVHFPLVHPGEKVINFEYDRSFLKYFGDSSGNKIKKLRAMIRFLNRSLRIKTRWNRFLRKIYRKCDFCLNAKSVSSVKGCCILAAQAELLTGAQVNNKSNDENKIRIGYNSQIYGNLSTFSKEGLIYIGEHCFIGLDTRLWSRNRIVIGNRVLIAHNVNIFDSATHSLSAKKRHKEFLSIFPGPSPLIGSDMGDEDILSDPVVIEDDVWIGCNVVILKGVTIGRGAVIGAGAVISKDVQPYNVVAGNPQRIIGNSLE